MNSKRIDAKTWKDLRQHGRVITQDGVKTLVLPTGLSTGRFDHVNVYKNGSKTSIEVNSKQVETVD